MIRVTITLISAVDSSRNSILGQMDIANDGSVTDVDSNKHNYDGRLMRKPDFKSVTRTATVHQHDRKNLTIWHLVAKMLLAMGYLHDKG